MKCRYCNKVDSLLERCEECNAWVCQSHKIHMDIGQGYSTYCKDKCGAEIEKEFNQWRKHNTVGEE